MPKKLEEYNPKFITWAQNNGINLDEEEDWLIWAQCWVDGYVAGVDDVKAIIQGG